jgi:hypothetical protein
VEDQSRVWNPRIGAFEVAQHEQEQERNFKLPDMSDDNVAQCFCVLFGIGVLLMLILLPLSFNTLKEEELAFSRSTVSSKIDFDKVYCCGHFHLGPTRNFQKINRHVHTVWVYESNAWTCPAENGTCKELSGSTNEVGQTIYSTFAVNFRVIRDRENVQLAYEKYQFDDERVRQAVKALALENSKEVPQKYSVEQIYAAHTRDNPQIIVSHDALNLDLKVFGFELQDVIVTEMKMDVAQQAKFLTQELRVYQDDIIRQSWTANETRLKTAGMVNEVNIEAISATRAIKAEADAKIVSLEADLEAYRRVIDINATTLLIEMYKRVFNENTTTEMDIAEMAASSMYIDQIMNTGSTQDVHAIFMDSDSNRLFTQDMAVNS